MLRVKILKDSAAEIVSESKINDAIKMMYETGCDVKDIIVSTIGEHSKMQYTIIYDNGINKKHDRRD